MNTQMLISPENQVSDEPFDPAPVEKILSNNEDVESWVKRYAFFAATNLEIDSAYFYCTDFENQGMLNDLQLIQGTISFSEENGVIVSESFAQENSLSLNQHFEIYIDRQKSEVIVKAIAAHKAFFRSGNFNTVISKYSFANELLNLSNKINRIDITLKSLDKIDTIIENMNSTLASDPTTKMLTAESIFSGAFYDAYVATIELALRIFMSFMLFVSIYVIFSVFKAHVYNSMGEMATLRSLGFSIKHCRFLVLGQSLLITIVASAAGLLLSIPFITLLMSIFKQDTGPVSLAYTPVIVSIILVNLISLLSVWLAAERFIKTGIVDLLKNNIVQDKPKKKAVLFCIGCFFFAMAVVSFFFLPPVLSIYAYFVSVLSALIGVVITQGSLMTVYAKSLKWIFRKKLGSWGLFSKMLPFHCGSYTRSVSVITLVLAITTLTVSISAVIKESMLTVHKGADVYIHRYGGGESNFDTIILNESNVLSYVYQKRKYIDVEKSKVTISGISVKEYSNKDYERVIGASRQEVFGKLNQENSIIVTTTFSKNNNKKVGDMIRVSDKNLTIVGEVSSFEDMGGLLFVSDQTFDHLFAEWDMELYLLEVRSGATQAVIESVSSQNDELNKQNNQDNPNQENCTIGSVQELSKAVNEDNQLIINVIYLLCAISLFISAISMISSLMINFAARKRDFLIYRAIGLPKKMIVNTEFLESVSMGLYSGMFGVVSGLLLLPAVLQILSFYVGDLEYSANPMDLLGLIIVSCVLAAFSVLITVQRQVLKRDLIAELKRD